jgi:hypothetical protein
MAEVVTKSKEVPAKTAPESPSITLTNGATQEEISAAIEKHLKPISDSITAQLEAIKGDVAKALAKPTEPPANEVVTADVTELTKKYAAEHGLDPDAIVVTIKETKKSEVGGGELTVQKSKIAGDSETDDGDDLDDQLEKATPEVRREALAEYMRGRLGI